MEMRFYLLCNINCVFSRIKSRKEAGLEAHTQPWTSDHAPPSQHTVHRPSGGGGLIWGTKCFSEVGQDPWGWIWGGRKKNKKQAVTTTNSIAASCLAVARTTAKAGASGKHPPHGVKVELLWGTDVLRVSSSVSNKRPQQPWGPLQWEC